MTRHPPLSLAAERALRTAPVYEVVVRKEAERRAEAAATPVAEAEGSEGTPQMSFGEMVKTQVCPIHPPATPRRPTPHAPPRSQWEEKRRAQLEGSKQDPS